MEKKIYQRLAELIRWNPQKDSKWVDKREEEIEAIMKTAPHGSGIDGGVRLVEAECSESKLVFRVEYHPMNQDGYYGEWLTANIAVTPTLTSEGFYIDCDFAEDIEQINNDNYNEAVKYINDEYPELKGYEREDKISECTDYICADDIAEFISDCFSTWLLTDYKEVK
jgi:choline kinase